MQIRLQLIDAYFIHFHYFTLFTLLYLLYSFTFFKLKNYLILLYFHTKIAFHFFLIKKRKKFNDKS